LDSLGRACAGVADATACSYPTCESITNSTPTGLSDCDAIAPGCMFYFNSCITPGACPSYLTGGSGAIVFCGGLKDSNGV
jgi:hypothetical protein